MACDDQKVDECDDEVAASEMKKRSLGSIGRPETTIQNVERSDDDPDVKDMHRAAILWQDEDLLHAHGRLLSEAATVRAAFGSKRSDKVLHLFEFLLERTIRGNPPTETEIANEAFILDRTRYDPKTATVRVYVHRLRKALEAIYPDSAQPRLTIPKGEYSIILVDGDTPLQERARTVADAGIASNGYWKALGVTFSLLLLANIAIWWSPLLSRPRVEDSALAGTTLWTHIAHSDRPITIVLGDYYWFAESMGERNGVPGWRLVRDLSINVPEDLDLHLMAHPEKIAATKRLDLRYVATSAVTALGEVFAAVQSLETASSRRITMVPTSQLTAEILKTSDIIYVGQISGLGSLLRNPLFNTSGFRVGATYDELIDLASNQRYQSDGGLVLPDERTARRDYGFIAGLPGPAGNYVVIIAGMRDAALLQMAELANDSDKLQPLGRHLQANAPGFEALYQVRTMGNLNLSGQLLIERPLRGRGIWDRSGASQRFPNDIYEGGGYLKK